MRCPLGSVLRFSRCFYSIFFYIFSFPEQLYTSSCPSVRPSVCRGLLNRDITASSWVSEWVSEWVKELFSPEILFTKKKFTLEKKFHLKTNFHQSCLAWNMNKIGYQWIDELDTVSFTSKCSGFWLCCVKYSISDKTCQGDIWNHIPWDSCLPYFLEGGGRGLLNIAKCEMDFRNLPIVWKVLW